MRQLAVLVSFAGLAAAATLISGCAATPAPPPQPTAGVTAWDRAAPTHVPGEPSSKQTATSMPVPPPGVVDPPEPERGTSSDQPRDVETQAATEVIRLLEQENLLVLELDTEIEHADPGQATVVVAVLYGTGRSHPYDAHYRVGFVLAGDAWKRVSVEAAP